MSDTDTTPAAHQRRRWALSALGPLLLIAVASLSALWWLRGDTENETPVSIEAVGPRFRSITELVDASDLVVHGTVTEIDDGRTITDSADPAAGITTQLAQVDVDMVLVGQHDGPLIVEQEAALLDGTPVVVNGVAPLNVGDVGYLFLIRGESDEFPYTALVNEQGWVPVVDGTLAPIDPTVWGDLVGRPARDLDDAVAGR